MVMLKKHPPLVYKHLGMRISTENINQHTSYYIMRFRGINYNAGIDYNQCGQGKEIETSQFLSDLRYIKELNCNSIRLYGSHNKKLLHYSKLALSKKLKVWVSPRYIGKNRIETLTLLLDFCRKIEKLRSGNNVVLIIGNEFTIDMAGIVKGATQMQRAHNYNRTDDKLLRDILLEFVPKIRRIFRGKIAYAALSTEKVDHSLFDYIALNYYWDWKNMFTYSLRLRNLSKKYCKPLIITEFGTCCYKFASCLDGAAFYPIQEWKFHKIPLIKWLIVRDEMEQVRCIRRCLSAFKKSKVEGAFIFDYAEKWKVDSLDLASFGIMKCDKDGKLSPKLAFDYIKREYGSMFRR